MRNKLVVHLQLAVCVRCIIITQHICEVLFECSADATSDMFYITDAQHGSAS